MCPLPWPWAILSPFHSEVDAGMGRNDHHNQVVFFRLCSYSPFSKSTWPQKIGVFHSTAEICHQSWRFNCRRKPRLGWKWGAGSILKYMKIDGLWAAATKSTRCPFKATRRWAKVKLWIGQKSDPKISKIGRGMLRAKGFGHFEH